MTVRIGGHRGFGCTDHDAFLHRLGVRDAPAENTLESVQLAFRSGAGFVEVDVVQSLDEKLLITHSVNPSDHFFGHEKPEIDTQSTSLGRHQPVRRRAAQEGTHQPIR